MPMIPRGQEGLVLQTRAPVSPFEDKAGKALADTVSGLGNALIRLAKVNEKDSVNAAAQKYEYESRKYMLSEAAKFNPMDPTGLDFEQNIKPGLEKMRDSIMQEYGVSNKKAWDAASLNVDNSLVTQFMAEQAKLATKKQELISQKVAADRASIIYESDNPSAAFQTLAKQSIIDIESGIADGKYYPEQRDYLIAQKMAEVTTAATDALVSRNRHKEALAILDTQRENFDQKTFMSMRDSVVSKYESYQNQAYTDEQRRQSAEDRKRKETIEATELELMVERETVGNDTRKLVELSNKAKLLAAEGKLDSAALTRVLKSDSLTGEMTDQMFAAKVYQDLANGKTSPRRALVQINGARISPKEKEDLSRAMNALIEGEKDRGEYYNQKLMEAEANFIHKSIDDSSVAKYNPAAAAKFKAAFDTQLAAARVRKGSQLSSNEIQSIRDKVSKQLGVNINIGTGRNLNVPNMGADQLKKRLDKQRMMLQRNRSKMTPDQIDASISEIQATAEALRRAESEKGVVK